MQGRARSPWWYIPTLYFQQGLPVIIIQQTAIIMYKRMGVPNDRIGLWTSLIAWPWFLKLLWGPLVDMNFKKRQWVLATQILITIGLAAAALVTTHSSYLPLTLAVFFVTALLSATHDIALDGYYLLALPREKQAFFMGVTSMFFRLAMVFGNGALVMLAGYCEQSGMSTSQSWQTALFASAVVYAVLMFYAFNIMPVAPSDQPVRTCSRAEPTFLEGFRSFFVQPRIIPIILFILFFRFGESMLTKMAGPFLLDSRAAGGLGLSTLQVGMIIGNIGVISLIAGGILGGILISKVGLRRCAWPMAITMALPNLLYIYTSKVQPGATLVSLVTGVEYFAYGFGMALYMVLTMYICQGSAFATSHYAIVTGLMSLGAMFAGIASGYLQTTVGYFWFFVTVCLCTIPGLILLKFVPLDTPAQKTKTEEQVSDALAQAATPVGSH